MQFQFNSYQRHFKQPLRTSHSIWHIREGIIISLQDKSSGKIGRGEIAPLPWFGSETLDRALEFCQTLGKEIALEDITNIPSSLPACQFALESALLNLQQSSLPTATDTLNYCYLLPAGETALNVWQEIYQQQGNNTFKWKIGVYPLAEEINILQQLVEALPPQVKIRLDANGGLNLTQAQQLLAITDEIPKIEFIEQPLSTDCFLEMLQLDREYKTSLALDESVASFEQLKSIHQQGWQGIFILKAAIMGFPSQLMAYCQHHSLDVVFSSVFETEIGSNAVLNLARQYNSPREKRAVGFGLNYFVTPN